MCVCVCAAHYRMLFISLLTSATEQIRSPHPDPWSERSKPSFIPTETKKHVCVYMLRNSTQIYIYMIIVHVLIILSAYL